MGSAGGVAQAGFLRALADHVERHDLAAVNISSDHAGGWSLHVFSGWTRCARTGGRLPVDVSAGLVGWARSLGVAGLVVWPQADQVVVRFAASIGGCPVVVWGCVDPLREAMGLTEVDTTITVAALAYFTEHGTARPDSAGERR